MCILTLMTLDSDVVGVLMYMNVYTYFNDSDVVGVFQCI